MARHQISIGLCSVSFLSVIASHALAADIVFTDQTAQAGINATHMPSFGVSSFLAGGAVGDFNNDGLTDIFFVAGGGGGGGGARDKLYINNGDGTFTDRAAEWGVDVAHKGTAATVGDFDGDGWQDVYVTSLGPVGGSAPGFHKLYRNNGNEEGPGFTDVASQAGVNFASPSQADGYGAAFGDYDLDGDLDLAVAGWTTSSQGNRLFRNNGNGTFTDATFQSGLSSSVFSINGFAPRFADMNNDLYPELIWIGDFGTSKYYVNNGNGTFTNQTNAAGMGLDGTEMGQTVADFDRDGLFDVYVTTISTNNLYHNLGNHQYTNIANSAGVANTGWGWGTVAVDFDHDGRMDLAATSQSAAQYLFRNVTPTGGIPDFVDVSSSSGFVSGVSGRGLSNFDYDNDGDQDLVIFPFGGPLKLFRNDLDQSAGDAHWIRIFLDTTGSGDLPPNGVGSRIIVSAGGQTFYGRIDGGSNYLSQSEMSAHFGVRNSTVIDEITVEWSNGALTTLADIDADQDLTISSVTIETPAIVSSAPADGSIDARQPSNPDGSDPAGWDAIEITFDGAVAGMTVAEFELTENGGDGIAPGIESVSEVDTNVLAVNLDSAIEPGAWTTLTVVDSGETITLGSLPADVNGDGTSGAGDVLALIDALNGQSDLPLHSTDIDRSGVATAADVLRTIDLLNGTGVYDVWNGQSLP